jgi:branched-chain amino acid transport system substrate-binding protein
MGAYVIKYVTEMVGELDREKFAETLHGLTLKADEYPGVLMDISWDENGETSHATAMGEIVDGKLEITKVLPAS